MSCLVLDADDLLTAHQTKGSRYTRIRLPLFNMFRVDLTLPPVRTQTLKRGENRKRRGIYLDDVMWRVVCKLLQVLMYHNTISMMMLLSASTAKNVTNTLSGTVAHVVQQCDVCVQCAVDVLIVWSSGVRCISVVDNQSFSQQQPLSIGAGERCPVSEEI